MCTNLLSKLQQKIELQIQYKLLIGRSNNKKKKEHIKKILGIEKKPAVLSFSLFDTSWSGSSSSV